MNRNHVAIVTLYSERNYGSFLQAYALKKYIDSIDNYEATVLRINPRQNEASVRLRRAMSEGGIKLVASRVTKKILSRFLYNKNVMMRNRILEQSINLIASEEMYSSSDEYVNANSLYDIFIAGSDQIWGDSGNDLNVISMYYLKNITKPKISYAPSIGGGANFNTELVHHIIPLLNEFNHISVREKEGKKFLSGILGDEKTIYQAIDPTLLLTSSEWDEELKDVDDNFKFKNDKYIFVYLLGSSEEHRNFISKFAKSKKMKIISFPYLQMHTKQDDNFADVDVFDATPFDYLLYIKYADYVFTDSFHGAVFSGLFHKDFYVFKKENSGKRIFENQFARLEDLLDLFAAQERYIKQYNIEDMELNKATTDWEQSDKRISMRQNECRKWLKHALDSSINDKIEEVCGI